jgi:hypothetical protein
MWSGEKIMLLELFFKHGTINQFLGLTTEKILGRLHKRE